MSPLAALRRLAASLPRAVCRVCGYRADANLPSRSEHTYKPTLRWSR